MPANPLTAQLPAPGWLPPGERIYAIGDVHGCAGRLAALHALVREDLAARPVPRPFLLHLGDYVDRGPDSAGVLALLRGSLPPGLPGLQLRGNHDQMMLDALAPGASGAALDLWLMNGGGAALASYGATAGPGLAPGAVPAADLAWLGARPLRHTAGGYLFVHAGIAPHRALDDQRPQDLLWIREPFLSWRGRLPAVVVHGHTPSETPQLRPHRIGLDTGAVFGGSLTCGVLEGRTIGFLQA